MGAQARIMAVAFPLEAQGKAEQRRKDKADERGAEIVGQHGHETREGRLPFPTGRTEAEAEARPRRHPPISGLAIDRSRSEEHTSELQSLMRISYAVFCLKNKIRLIHNQF